MIVVTTPTGNIGRVVVQKLLNAGKSVRVIARDPSKLSQQVRDKADIVKGSHNDTKLVTEALKGADSVFFCCPPSMQATNVEEYYASFAKAVAAGIKANSVKRAVTITSGGRGVKNAGMINASLSADEIILASGVNCRSLLCGSFMENMFGQMQPLKHQGMFTGARSATLKAPTVATSDIGAVAAKFLLDDSWTGQEDIPVHGAEDLSNDDMAAITSEVLGKPIRYQEIPKDKFKEIITQYGGTEATAQSLVDMFTASETQKFYEFEPRTAETTTPTTFKQWCETVLKPALEAA